ITHHVGSRVSSRSLGHIKESAQPVHAHVLRRERSSAGRKRRTRSRRQRSRAADLIDKNLFIGSVGDKHQCPRGIGDNDLLVVAKIAYATEGRQRKRKTSQRSKISAAIDRPSKDLLDILKHRIEIFSLGYDHSDSAPVGRNRGSDVS